MEDPTKMYQKMCNDLASIYQDTLARLQALPQAWYNYFMENWQGWINNLLKDALNPDMVMGFIRSMGIDMSQLPGMIGQQPGFDPYRVLGLDKSASDEQIKDRYRELLRHLHPDTAGVEGTSFMLQLFLAAYAAIKRERGEGSFRNQGGEP